MSKIEITISQAENGYHLLVVADPDDYGCKPKSYVFQSLKPALSKAKAILEPKGEVAELKAGQPPANE